MENTFSSLVRQYKNLPFALRQAKELSKLTEQGKLRNTLGEPIDWVEIYTDWNTDKEERTWVSGVGFTSDKYKEG